MRLDIDQLNSRLAVLDDSISSTRAKKLLDLIASNGLEAAGLAKGLPAAAFLAKGFLPPVAPSCLSARSFRVIDRALPG